MKQFLHILTFATVLSSADGAIDFNTDVRPILNKNCTSCHGGVKQAGGVSFILRDQALGTGKSGEGTIVSGHPHQSEMIRRILLPDSDDERMPPADKHPERLSDEDVATLQQWIREGAEWGEHWAYVAPKSQPLPDVDDPEWPTQRIDHFIFARMHDEGLSPSPEAAPGEWLRRVSFALTGLPPQPEWMELVESSFDPPTRGAIVDQLMADPAFGERWAAVWMDLARYADSMGYERDPNRIIWPYRDWVIRAFNEDMDYGTFVTKQLAGDQLPDATLDDFVATGFLRNSQTNTEGGTDDEEFRIAALVDRVSTAWTAMQGVTMACVQCHSHPYDPFPHEDFYEFAAYFNNTADADLSSDFPTIKVPENPDQADELLAWQRELWDVRHARNQAANAVQQRLEWTPMALEHRWTNKPQVRLEEIATEKGPVQVARGTPTRGSVYELVGTTGGDDPYQSIEAIRVRSLMPPGTSAHTPAEAAVVTGFELRIRQEDQPPPTNNFQVVDVQEVVVDDSNGVIGEPAWGAFPNQFIDRWVVLIPKKPIVLGPSGRLSVVLTQNRGRDGSSPPVLRRFAIDLTSDPALREHVSQKAYREARKSEHQLTRNLKGIKGTTTPVLLERRFAQRKTAVFDRGNFLRKTDIVTPGLPGVLAGDLEAGDRLAMARWFASPENPLTARVWMNRVWAQVFGRGLVATEEDFGSTGMLPSHPALLDDLAWRFPRQYGNQLKPLLRELVLSSTFLQAATVTDQHLEADPQNRLLARGPRNRLTAEMVRDHALATAGLLSDKMFGPPVMPPQPDGIWDSPYSGAQWKNATGEDRYRRAVYTYWRRSAPYPAFETFDAPERKVCSPRRISTNTPLQALVTLNDPVYLEAAQHLAQRMVQQAPDDLAGQLAYGYQLATTRKPDADELATLESLLADLTQSYHAEPETAGVIADKPETAAMVVVANALLNLDAALNW